MKSLAIDLFCGLGGWTDGLLAAGFDVVGFDITRHEYTRHIHHPGNPTETVIDRYPAQLVLQDILTVHGSQFCDAAVIVASPPCQNYSYLAMPWSRSTDPENSKAAKALRKKWETEGPDNRLFDACFRIQREAIFARSRKLGCCTAKLIWGSCPRCFIPLIVENVCGAVPWVGREKAKFGSFYLWGDVAQVGNRVFAGRDLRDVMAGRGRFGMGVAPESSAAVTKNEGGGGWFAIGNAKEKNCPDGRAHTRNLTPDGNGIVTEGRKSNPDGTAHPQGSWFRIADSSQGDRGQKVPGFRFDGSGRSFQSASVEAHGVKQKGNCGETLWKDRPVPRFNDGETTHMAVKIGGDWFSDPNSTCRKHGSRSNARKAASAMIAKIPYALSEYVARVHLPE